MAQQSTKQGGLKPRKRRRFITGQGSIVNWLWQARQSRLLKTRGHGKLRLSEILWTKVCCIVLFPSKEPRTIGGHLRTLDYIQKLKRPLRIPPKRTKPHKFSQIISQKIGKIGKIDYPISDSSTGLGNTKRPIQHTLVHQLSGDIEYHNTENTEKQHQLQTCFLGCARFNVSEEDCSGKTFSRACHEANMFNCLMDDYREICEALRLAQRCSSFKKNDLWVRNHTHNANCSVFYFNC